MKVVLISKSKEHLYKRSVDRWLLLSFILTTRQQILNRDDESKDKAPEVMKRGSQNQSPNGTRSFSTYARRRAEVDMTEAGRSDVNQKGHIFDLPSLPLPSDAHLKHRYDPIVKQITGLIMRDGKLGVAQRVRSSVPLFYSGHILRIRRSLLLIQGTHRTRLEYSTTYEPPHRLLTTLPDL